MIVRLRMLVFFECLRLLALLDELASLDIATLQMRETDDLRGKGGRVRTFDVPCRSSTGPTPG